MLRSPYLWDRDIVKRLIKYQYMSKGKKFPITIIDESPNITISTQAKMMVNDSGRYTILIIRLVQQKSYRILPGLTISL